MAAFASSYIKTTTAQVTRAADSASMTGANFSSWYRQDEGTLFVERTQGPIDSTAARRFVAITDGSTTNSIQMYQAGGGTTNGVTVVAGVNDFAPNLSGIPAVGASVKTVFAFNGSGKAMVRDGGAVSSSAILPPRSGMNSLFIGSQLAGQAVSCTSIRKIAYYPKRIADDQNQGLTS